MARARRRRSAAASLGWPLSLALLLVVMAVHAAALFSPRVFYSRDLFSFWHPAMDAFVHSVAGGAWPSWNPWFGFGEPLAANPNFQIAYPPTWLNLVLPAGLYFKLFVVAHTLGGALGAAALARRLRVARLGAFAAGATFGASGPFLSAVGLFHHFAGMAWTPWVLLALDRSLRHGGARTAIVLGATAAGQALAGSADLCFMTALLCAGWLLMPLARGALSRRSAFTLVGAVVFAALLAAIQWVPAMALLPGTYRASPVAGSSLYWSLHPWSLADLLVPRLTTGAALTDAMGATARARLFEGREPLLASIYLGLPAAWAVAAALLTRRHRRLALLTAAGFALLVMASLGRHAPLLPALLRLPGLALFRFPPKYLLPAALLWALLVGLGVDALARGRPRVATAGLALAGAAGALLALMSSGLSVTVARALAEPQPGAGLLGHVHSRLVLSTATLALGALLFLTAARFFPRGHRVALVLTLAAVGDLVGHARRASALAPGDLMRYRPPILEQVRRQAAPVRVYAVPYPAQVLNDEFVRHPVGWPAAAGWVLGFIDRLTPAIGARWGVLGSFDGDMTGLSPAPLGRLSQRVQELSSDAAGLRLLQAGGVDYVVSLDRQVFGGRLLPEWEHASVYRSPVQLLRVPDSLPKAFVVPRARVVPDLEQALRLLEDPALDLRQEVIVASAPGGGRHVREVGASGPAEARLLWRRSNGQGIEVRSPTAGYLVVLEAFDQAWAAAVDGVPVPIMQANLLFRAVPIPAGLHRVEMEYRPRSFRWGGFASAAAVLAGAILLRSGALR